MSEGRFSNLELEGPSAELEPEQNRFIKKDRDEQHFFALGQSRELAGDFEAALRHYSAALGEDPLLLEGWLGQLRMLLVMGELPEAKMWADKALERFPDQPRLLAAKAVALCRMGSRKEARGLCDAALKASGEDPFVWLCRGEIICGESTSAARRCFDRVFALAADNVSLHIDVGALYLEHKLYADAISTLQNACMRAPRAARAFYVLGCAQREKGMPTHARASFDTALGLEPQLESYRRAAADVDRSPGGLLGGFWRRMTQK